MGGDILLLIVEFSADVQAKIISVEDAYRNMLNLAGICYKITKKDGL